MSVKTLVLALAAGGVALAAAGTASAMPLQTALPAAAAAGVAQTVASDDSQAYRPHRRKGAPRPVQKVRPAPVPPVDYSYSYVAPGTRGGFGGFGFGYDYTPHELYYYDVQREQTPMFGH